MSRLRLLALVWCACATARAEAAALQQITSFGANPSGLNMYVYVPSPLAARPPIVVALHYCGSTASTIAAGWAAGLVSGADQRGYIVVFPETVSAANNKCWDVSSTSSLSHGGGGDSAGIISMVKHAISRYGADASRVYAIGTASGAMMTQVLLGAYPDVFRAGSEFAGVPFACFAGATGYWSETCATGLISRTGAQWGDLVRAAFPGYAGPWPRIQLWHGEADKTVSFANFGEAIAQWTNVLGLSATPSSTEQDTPRTGYVRTRYQDACGYVRVEAIRASGVDHAFPVEIDQVLRFFALDAAGDPDPGSCTTTSSSSGGSSSSGSGSSSGGASSSGGGSSSSGSASSSGGSSSSGSASSSGGGSSSGNASSSGGGSSSGGSDGGPDATAPTAPGAPRLTLVTSSSIALAWPPSTDDVGVTGYDVFQVSATGDVQIARTTVTEITVSRLASSTAYAFKVKARDGAGNLSPPSATVDVVTLNAGTPSHANGVGCSSAPSPGFGAALLLVGLVLLAPRIRAGTRPARARATDGARRGDDARTRGRAPHPGEPA